MATAKLVLDKRRNNSFATDSGNKGDKNKYPLRIRIFHGRQRREITVNYKFTTSEWIESENRVAKSYQNSTRVNSAIQKRFSIANTVLMDYEVLIKNMDIDSVKKLVETEIDKQITPVDPDSQIQKIISESSHQTSFVTLEQFGNRLVERTKLKKEFGTARWYEDGFKAIKNFNNGKDIPITCITVSFLEDFQAYHIAKGNSKNTISAYLRAVRAITNYAVKEVFHGKRFENYPWGSEGFSIPSAKTKKRAVTKETIDKLRKLEIKENSALWNSQNYFLFMFNNLGMNFMDVAKLKVNQIVEPVFNKGELISGRIEYTRSKNDKDFSIKLTKESLKILNCYKISQKKLEDFIFPIAYESSETGWESYRKKLTRNNKRFRALAKLIGENELNLTTYVARHSWATIAKKSGVSHAIIGDGLGHSDSKTTEAYLDEFEIDVLDNANELIVS